ncbi:MAG: hypothetical protein Q9168_005080 [Polycauliona sp. 1 TL-2023]
MGVQLSPDRRRLVQNLNKTIHPNTAIVIDWLLETAIGTGVLQHPETLPTAEVDRILSILDLRDSFHNIQIAIPNEVTAALSAIIPARQEKVAIYREQFDERYAESSGPINQQKKSEHNRNMTAQNKIVTGLLRFQRLGLSPLDQVSDLETATTSAEPLDTVAAPAINDESELENATPSHEAEVEPVTLPDLDRWPEMVFVPKHFREEYKRCWPDG